VSTEYQISEIPLKFRHTLLNNFQIRKKYPAAWYIKTAFYQDSHLKNLVAVPQQLDK